jgi:hypothetical protein
MRLPILIAALQPDILSARIDGYGHDQLGGQLHAAVMG